MSDERWNYTSESLGLRRTSALRASYHAVRPPRQETEKAAPRKKQKMQPSAQSNSSHSPAKMGPSRHQRRKPTGQCASRKWAGATNGTELLRARHEERERGNGSPSEAARTTSTKPKPRKPKQNQNPNRNPNQRWERTQTNPENKQRQEKDKTKNGTGQTLIQTNRQTKPKRKQTRKQKSENQTKRIANGRSDRV